MNRISWLDWGKEAFDLARSSGKPILLDITGSWCHWCHVMDETSYSDQAVINIVNKSFVPVRVDTDRRPDVNRRYNLGGWPTTAFLDSDGKIITGGTYIPPQQMREALRSVLDFYSTNKGKAVSKLQPVRVPHPDGEQLSEKIARDIATTVALNFDLDYGGFGSEPKFPHADALDYALLRYRYLGEKEMLAVLTSTLDHMGSGGVYDQVEQGFFRYSTTRDWSIPHFEKMAEDNAKLLGVYLHAYQVTGKPSYKEKAEGIVAYVLSYLTDTAKGGFFGSQDANEEYYGLNLPARRNHKAPAVDKTLYTNYNALMISSFFLAANVLDRVDLGRLALKTLDRILKLGEPGGLPFHYWREGSEGTMVKGLLVDSALLANSLIDAYDYSGKPAYLDGALKVAKDCIGRLSDEALGGFWDIPSSDSNLGELRTRDKPIDENSLMATVLMRLSWLTQNDSLSDIGRRTLELFTAEYERYGLAAATYALAVDSYIYGPIGITIVGSQHSKELGAFRAKALSVYPARRYILHLDSNRDSSRIASLGYDLNATPVAYVCVGKTCGPPIHDPLEIDPSVSTLLGLKPLAS